MTLAWLQLSYRQIKAYSFSTETAVTFITAKIVASLRDTACCHRDRRFRLQKAVSFYLCARTVYFSPIGTKAFAASRTMRRGRNRECVPVVVFDNREETLPKRHHAGPVVKFGGHGVVGVVLNRCEVDDIVRSDRRSRRRQAPDRNRSYVFPAIPRQGDVSEIMDV